MPDLLTTQLPGGVRELSLAEIIAIRRDGVFDDWRRMLGNALNDVAQVHADELVHDEVIRQSLADKLAEATATVRAQAAKGSVLSRLRSATVDLSVSTAIGLGATEIIHTEVAGVGVGGVTLLAKAVLDWWRGRPRAGQRALLRHAAVFTQPAVSS